ncbi:hypothetical protein GCM10023187_05270 [Nibrella viscosa]|uniref:Aminoglycoside phosphotransferase domain-containing protein n=1 Tax=Nibrella viscosa TaxID=1084524 RepID=A0ABP8JVV0_9BACT
MAYLLNNYRLFHYLIGRNGVGIVPKAIQSINFNTQRRIFKAEWPDGKSWFVKQPFQLTDSQRFTIANEAHTLKIIREVALLQNSSPQYIFYDPIHKILITDFFSEHISLSNQNSISLSKLLLDGNLTRKVAETLAIFHQQATCIVKNTKSTLPFYFFKPPFLADNIAFLSCFFNHELLSPVKRNWLLSLTLESGLSDVLQNLNYAWKSDRLIHGDAVFTNLLVQSKEGNIQNVKLCDWEFAGWGDADWDAACFFQSILDAYMKMNVNHAIVLAASQDYYRAYTNVCSKPPDLMFEEWFCKVIKLSAVGLLERLLGDAAQARTIKEVNNKLSERVEFLLTRVLLNSNLLRSF